MKPLRLMIVDDYEPTRIGIRSTFDLENDIEVVGDYGDGESAVRDAEMAILTSGCTTPSTHALANSQFNAWVEKEPRHVLSQRRQDGS